MTNPAFDVVGCACYAGLDPIRPRQLQLDVFEGRLQALRGFR